MSLTDLEPVVTASTRAVLVLDLQGVVFAANASAEELFESRTGELAGLAGGNLFSKDSWRLIEEAVRSTRRTKRARKLNVTTRSKSGRRRKMNLVASPVLEDTNEYLGTSLAMQPAKERHKEPESVAGFVAVIRQTQGPRSQHPPSAEISTWTDSAAELFGYDDLEIIGKDVELLVEEENRRHLRPLFNQILGRIPLERFEHFNLPRSGGPALTSTEILPVVDAGERVVGFAARVHRLDDGAAVLVPSVEPGFDVDRWFDAVQRIPAPAGIGVLSFDPVNDTEFFVGARARELFGLDPDTPVLPGLLREYLHPDDRADVFETLQRAFITGEALDSTFRVLRDGDVRWLRASGRCVTDERDESSRFFGVVEDVTEAQLQRQELDRVERFAELLFEKSAIAAAAGGPDQRIIMVNDAMLRLLGFTREAYLGRTVAELSHPDDRANDATLWRDISSGTRDNYDVAKRILKADGTYVPGRMYVTAIRDAEGRLVQTLGQFLDQTEIYEAQEQLRHMSLYDTITSLPRWDLFLDRVRYELDWARHTGRFVGVALIDIDRFVEVNDQVGNDGGDMTLMEIGKRLQGCVQQIESLGRFEGDSFAVVRGDFTDSATLDVLARELLGAFDQPFVINGKSLLLKCSIGTAYTVPGGDPERLIRNAQFALAEAKERGGSRAAAYDESLRLSSRVRVAAETRLRAALDEDRFIVHYQPIADLETGQFVSVEALLRWEDTEVGLLGPDEFISVAEESGLIAPIGGWVLERACAEALSLVTGPDSAPVRLSVNVSPVQLRRKNFDDVVRRALDRTGLPPERLTIELTESTFVEDVESGRGDLERVQDLGVRLSVDDFGSGYSGFSRIKRYAINELKIDASFVSSLDTDEKARVIIPAIIEMGRALKADVVAEGVENGYEVDWLLRHGCRLAQGFYFAPPMPIDQCAEVLRRGWRSAKEPSS